MVSFRGLTPANAPSGSVAFTRSVDATRGRKRASVTERGSGVAQHAGSSASINPSPSSSRQLSHTSPGGGVGAKVVVVLGRRGVELVVVVGLVTPRPIAVEAPAELSFVSGSGVADTTEASFATDANPGNTV